MVLGNSLPQPRILLEKGHIALARIELGFTPLLADPGQFSKNPANFVELRKFCIKAEYIAVICQKNFTALQTANIDWTWHPGYKGG